MPLGIVVLPSLAQQAALGQLDAFAALISRAVRLTLFVMLPVTGISIVLRHEIVGVLFGYSRFDAAALDLIAATLLTFLLGLTAHALIAILARAFYARHDTRRPGRGGDPRRRRELDPGRCLRRPPRPARARPGDRGRPRGSRRSPCSSCSGGRCPSSRSGRCCRSESAPWRSRSAGPSRRPVSLAGLDLALGPDPGRSGLVVRIVVVGLVWLLTSAAVAVVLRIAELPAMIGLMLDLIRRRRPA